jgi:methionine synthase I (cobalamin-dependent)
LWETEAGEAWLQQLTVADLYTFGMECHVGADKLSQFFKLIRIDTHVGVSPSALRQQLSHMESLLPLFQQQSEEDIPA